MTASGHAAMTAEQAGAVVLELSDEQLVTMLAGRDLWSVPLEAVESSAVLVVSDGPNGARGRSFIAGRSACFPCATALGATFDVGLVGEVGAALGAETRRAGAQVLLAPTVNLHRHPLGGRHFECFSEDPELTAQLAAAYILGVQGQGVGACVKHFVCNDGEFERMKISVEVDEAVRRELYLLPFERAVQAGVWSVMAAYNRLDGTYASEHHGLLTTLLREEWGFDGVAMSDWFATHSTAEALKAGLDLEMPGPPLFRGQRLLAALEEGLVRRRELERSAARVVALAGRSGAIGAPLRAALPEASAVREVIRRAAVRSMVLLKNEGALPLLAGTVGRVALIGPLVEHPQWHGGGSAQVNPEHVSPLAPALGRALGPGTTLEVARGSVLGEWPSPLGPPELSSPDGQPGATVSYLRRADGELLAREQARTVQLFWLGEVCPGTPNGEVTVVVEAELRSPDSGLHQLVAQLSGRVRVLLDGECVLEAATEEPDAPNFELSGTDERTEVLLNQGEARRLRIEFEPHANPGVLRLQLALLPPDPGDLIEVAARTAATCDAAIVVVGSPHGYESEGRDRAGLALPGDQDALVRAVARANRRTVVVVNTGSPVTMPWADEVAAIVQMWFPGQEAGEALAALVCGEENFSGRLPTTFFRAQQDVPSDPFFPGTPALVRYEEGFRIGYRSLPGEPIPDPLFAFGLGLSYSRFTLGAPALEDGPELLRITVPVTNVEGPPGRAVLQCYWESGEADRPVRELKAFCSLEVAPGETRYATMSLDRRLLRRFRDGKFVPHRGPVRLRIGTSSVELPLVLEAQALN